MKTNVSKWHRCTYHVRDNNERPLFKETEEKMLLNSLTFSLINILPTTDSSSDTRPLAVPVCLWPPARAGIFSVPSPSPSCHLQRCFHAHAF